MPQLTNKAAMISSTSIDLPEHRREVMEACLREGIFPIGMEQLPARDATGVQVSLEMADTADVYIGIYAWRYGWVPDFDNPGKISITEMEFNRAVERKIPILVFLIHKDHPLTIEMVETDKDAQKKLAELKDRARKGRGRREFKSPEELHGEVIHALSDLKQRERESSGEKAAPDFHPPNLIPKLPETYVAHPYSLLQTKDVVGRQAELNLLTDWVTTNKQVPADTRIFNLVAIGGMGKSALTWKWFNDIAPNELPKLAGRLWWSFYESDAHWENFIIRTLAYVSGQSEKTVRELKAPDREDQLWHILDQQPFLLVLDGLERILLAYARMDAAQMLDEDLDEKTANRVAQAIGLPPSAADSFIRKHQLRLTADHRTGHFLRRLARIRNSRILITTRLYPTELQCETGEPLPGCCAKFLEGLTDSDALNLWREFKVTGSTEQLLPLFRSFGNYPLLIRALAGEVAAFRGGPSDFDKWRAQNPKFDPTRLPLKNAKTHVLEYALHGLKPEHRQVLHTIAAFRMPATWETLRALLVDAGRDGFHSVPDSKVKDGDAVERVPTRPCRDDRALDAILTELEDRGLVGWDKQANRYDLHPVVRGVVWQALDGRARDGIYRELHEYFEAVPKPDIRKVESIEDLTPAIELYSALIRLGSFEEAYSVFRHHLDYATLHRLSLSRLRAELLEGLLDKDPTPRPRLKQPRKRTSAMLDLANTYHLAGQPCSAITIARHLLTRPKWASKRAKLAWRVLSYALRVAGGLREAEAAVLNLLAMTRQSRVGDTEVHYLWWYRHIAATRGEIRLGLIASLRAERLIEAIKPTWVVGRGSTLVAQLHLWLGQPRKASSQAEAAWVTAQERRRERDFIRAARLQGEAALAVEDMSTAWDRLHHSLGRARKVNLVEEELQVLVALAEWHRKKREFSAARELLDQIGAPAERGPFPLFHADALNVLAQIERDQGNHEAAIAAATKAYKLAWCDGISADGKVCYAYHYGLTNAREHLHELDTPEPQLPPFDASKFDPMPDVELNPKDEFWVDPDKLDS